MLKIAINGFGRIGRAAFKIAMDRSDVQVVAVNDPNDHKTMAYLLQYDSVYGRYNRSVVVDDDKLVVDGKEVLAYGVRDPGALPWAKLGVDVVIESTGVFTSGELARPHVDSAGARAVIISAPAKDSETPTFVIGVNDKKYQGESVISNASCTTNCISPIMKVLEDRFGVEKSLMTTIHSYTNDQSLVDGVHKDPRRGRAAAQNIIPTTTGAARATAETIPSLKEKFDGLSVRVPTAVVSLSDLTVLLSKSVTVEEINQAFREATKDPSLKNVLAITEDPVVSSDFIGSTYSAIVDLSLTQVVGGNLVKVVAWYDNEWGYSCRLVELAVAVGKHI